MGLFRCKARLAKGSTFIISLPVHQPTVENPPAEPNADADALIMFGKK